MNTNVVADIIMKNITMITNVDVATMKNTTMITNVDVDIIMKNITMNMTVGVDTIMRKDMSVIVKKMDAIADANVEITVAVIMRETKSSFLCPFFGTNEADRSPLRLLEMNFCSIGSKGERCVCRSCRTTSGYTKRMQAGFCYPCQCLL